MTDNFKRWLPLRNLGVAHLPQYGECPAVYALRDATSGQILKFGSTGRLRRRIFGNYLGGVGGGTTKRIYGQLFVNKMIDRVELAWIETSDKAEADRKEREFREAYKNANGKRPVWDLRG
jgi:hypothetical protein